MTDSAELIHQQQRKSCPLARGCLWHCWWNAILTAGESCARAIALKPYGYLRVQTTGAGCVVMVTMRPLKKEFLTLQNVQFTIDIWSVARECTLQTHSESVHCHCCLIWVLQRDMRQPPPHTINTKINLLGYPNNVCVPNFLFLSCWKFTFSNVILILEVLAGMWHHFAAQCFNLFKCPLAWWGTWWVCSLTCQPKVSVFEELCKPKLGIRLNYLTKRSFNISRWKLILRTFCATSCALKGEGGKPGGDVLPRTSPLCYKVVANTW